MRSHEVGLIACGKYVCYMSLIQGAVDDQ